LRVKALGRHVAELEALSTSTALVDIVAESRRAIDVRLQLARSEVELNTWRTTAGPAPSG
jgi:hypothetical protein